jgi:hypothetical protein
MFNKCPGDNRRKCLFSNGRIGQLAKSVMTIK